MCYWLGMQNMYIYGKLNALLAQYPTLRTATL